jgi:hypothetical protein
MNKFLMMSAAAVLSTTAGAAYASHTSFYSTTGGGGAYCNEWSVNWSGEGYGNSDSLGEYCGSTYAGLTSYGVAFKGKTTGMGTIIQLPASIATLEGAKSFGSDFVVSGKKIKTGESLVGWGTDLGTSVYEFSAGQVVVGQAPASRLIKENGKAVPVQKRLQEYALAHGHTFGNKQ